MLQPTFHHRTTIDVHLHPENKAGTARSTSQPRKHYVSSEAAVLCLGVQIIQTLLLRLKSTCTFLCACSAIWSAGHTMTVHARRRRLVRGPITRSTRRTRFWYSAGVGTTMGCVKALPQAAISIRDFVMDSNVLTKPPSSCNRAHRCERQKL